MTIGDVPGPVTDARAGDLLRRYRAAFGGSEVPVAVESIAEDPLGLRVLEAAARANMATILERHGIADGRSL